MLLVTTSKAPVTTSVALVPSSVFLHFFRHPRPWEEESGEVQNGKAMPGWVSFRASNLKSRSALCRVRSVSLGRRPSLLVTRASLLGARTLLGALLALLLVTSSKDATWLEAIARRILRVSLGLSRRGR